MNFVTLAELKAIQKRSKVICSASYNVQDGCIAFHVNNPEKDLILLGIAFVAVLGEERGIQLANVCQPDEPGQIGQFYYFPRWFCSDPVIRRNR